MSIDYDTAVVDMYATVKAAIDVGAPGIAVQYRGTPALTPLPSDASMLRVSVRSVVQGRRTIGGNPNGLNRFEANGVLSIEMYAPITPYTDKAQRVLATLLKNALTKYSLSGKVQFFRASVKDLPEDAAFYRRNVVADYQYDEEL